MTEGEQQFHRKSEQLPVAANHGHEMTVYNPYLQPKWVDDELDLRRLWSIVKSYRWLISFIVVICILTTIIASLMMRPVYRASALIEVKPDQRIVKFENLQQSDLQDREFLNTQINILRSESVSNSVIDSLTLAEDPEFNGEITQRGLLVGLKAVKEGLRSAFSALANSWSESGSYGDTGTSGLEDVSPEVIFERELVERYKEKLNVEEIPNSNLLRIYFDSFSSSRAAEIANSHVAAYIESNDNRRFNSTSSAKTFLQKQIEQTQAELESSEKELTDFARENRIVDVEDRSNFMEKRLTDLNNALTDTRQRRISAQVEYIQAQEGNLESIPAVLEGELIRRLQEQHATLLSEYEEMSRVFKDSYPKMQQLKSKLDNIKATLRDESRKLAEGLKNRYEQLVERENQLAQQVEQQQTEMLNLKDRAISYNILKREWEANRELYRGLLEKQKDVSVATGMEINNISIVDAAAVPTEKHSPKLTRNAAFAGVFGLIGGFGIAFLLAFMDNTFKNREDIETALGLAFLGIVPKVAADKKLDTGAPLSVLAYHQPTSALAESIRSVRTNILFSRPESVPKTLLVTSTAAGEGKSTIACNLALIMAQNGSRVVILEADLRCPNVSQWMNVTSEPGLTERLTGGSGEIIQTTAFENVYCVPAGKLPQNPAELLGNPNMEAFLKTLYDHFDFIILDGPPTLGLADSMVLSSKVDGVLMVVKAQSTQKDAVTETVARLRAINAPIVGVILNHVDLSHHSYGYYQNYYAYGEGPRGRLTAQG